MASHRAIRMPLRLAACIALLLVAEGASAQRGERRPARPEPREEASPPAISRGRGSEIYAVRPDHTGIITATTPNESGNLGGPSNGGSGGGR